MTELVKVEIMVAPETASALRDARRAVAAGRILDRIVHPEIGNDPLLAVLEATRSDARAAGLTDADIDAELEAYRAERRR